MIEFTVILFGGLMFAAGLWAGDLMWHSLIKKYKKLTDGLMETNKELLNIIQKNQEREHEGRELIRKEMEKIPKIDMRH